MESEAKIKAKSLELLVNSGYAGQFPVPVEKIANYLGFTCHYFTPTDKTKDVSGAVDRLHKKIFVNKKDSINRVCFTVAHEIGHIILHETDADFVDYRRPSVDAKEFEADNFAGNLLMPDNVFKEKWQEFKGNFASLSQFFGVSKSAVGVKAYKLGIE